MELLRTCAPAPATTRGRATLLTSDGTTLAFASGRSVFLLTLQSREVICLAGEHAHPCTVARFAPDGSAVATGDTSGAVRIWNARTHKTQGGALAALSGPVSDVAFSADARTVYVCGAAQGRGRLAGAYDVERGALLGALAGLTRNANTIDVTRDGSRVWTGDDAGTLFAHDAASLSSRPSRSDQGGRAINSVRCAPSHGVTAAAGGQALLLYGGDGVSPTLLTGHVGSTYCAEWSADGKHLLSSGADKSVRLWDATSAREVAKFSAGGAVEDMQVGCAWLHGCGAIAALSLSGDILLFDPRLAGCHTRILGHQRAVSAACGAGAGAWTGDQGGRVLHWPADGAAAVRVGGHKNAVTGAVLVGGQLVTAGLDDVAAWTPLAAGTAVAVSLPGAPASVGASADGLTVVLCTKGVQLARNGCLASLTPVPGATCATISQDGMDVAVGCEDGSLRLFTTVAEKLVGAGVLNKHRGAITAVAFDTTSARLASCDANREVVVWDRQPASPGWTPKSSLGSMVFHTARVTCLAWAPDGQHLASGSLDGTIILWDMNKPSARRTISCAHREGVTALAWPGMVVSGGADACVRFWA